MGNIVKIQNREIDMDSLTDKQIIKLFIGLKERELIIVENIVKLENQIRSLQKNN